MGNLLTFEWEAEKYLILRARRLSKVEILIRREGMFKCCHKDLSYAIRRHWWHTSAHLINVRLSIILNIFNTISSGNVSKSSVENYYKIQ